MADQPAYSPFIARDNAGREHNRVALLDLESLIGRRSHVPKRCPRFALRTGDEINDLVVAESPRVADVDDGTVRYIQNSLLIGNLDISLHRPAEHADLFAELVSNVKNDLKAMYRGRKGRDDQPSFRGFKDLFEGGNDGTLGRCSPRHCRVCRIAKQSENAFVADTPERFKVVRLADNGRVIDLVIAG